MFELRYDIISKTKKEIKKMTKTLKPRKTSKPEEIQTDTNVKTGYFDFKTGKVILDK